VAERQEFSRAADRGGQARRSVPPAARRDRLPPDLLDDRSVAGHGGGWTRATLLGQLQRTAGNDAVQRMVASYGVSRQAETGGATQIAGPVVADAAEPAPGQMRRTPFLAALRAEVEGVLASSDPMAQADALAHFPVAFANLANQDAAALTRSLQENLPGVEGGDASRYIAATGVAARARLAGDVVAAPTGVVGRVLSAVGGLVSALFKARDGVATPGDARVVRSRLGAGQPLDAGVRAPMEGAYGQDFSSVRVHTDSGAGALSDRLGARAFTVGRDVVFSPGEYQPGSLVGNALIAHELAHVSQQDGGEASSSVTALEEDADRAAVGAVVSRWTGTTGEQIDGFLPRLRAGLRLQRCAGPVTQVKPAGPGAAGGGQTCATLTNDQWRTAVEAAQALGGDKRAAAMTKLAEQALCELGIAVRGAGTSHTDAVHPDDYAEIPVLNFDAGLNSKSRWRTSASEDPRPVGDNVGYNFRAGARRFAIIGPRAISENSPLTTRQYAQHELSLVAHDRPAGQSKADEELLTWTEDFRGYFHQYLQLPRNRPTWQPLISYYASANPDVKQQSLRRLVDYFNNPPVPADQARRVREAIRMWMSKTSGTLITDLNAALPASP
jgi:hypothetical protein